MKLNLAIDNNKKKAFLIPPEILSHCLLANECKNSTRKESTTKLIRLSDVGNFGDLFIHDGKIDEWVFVTIKFLLYKKMVSPAVLLAILRSLASANITTTMYQVQGAVSWLHL